MGKKLALFRASWLPNFEKFPEIAMAYLLSRGLARFLIFRGGRAVVRRTANSRKDRR
jgi:hypothetical protein